MKWYLKPSWMKRASVDSVSWPICLFRIYMVQCPCGLALSEPVKGFPWIHIDLVTLILEFFLNVFTEFSEFRDKNIWHYSKRSRTCHPAISCVRDQDVTTVPARHMWGTGSLSWSQFMLQWFISFNEFAEFNESSALFRKNSIMFCRPC